MGASGAISAMKKSYEQNRALLRRKNTFEVLKDHYQNNPAQRLNNGNDYEALKQLRHELEGKRRNARWLVLLVAISLLILVILGWKLLYLSN